MFLLDTNVISELRKPEGRVSPEVVQWVSTQNATSLYVSMVTLYELEVGVRRLARLCAQCYLKQREELGYPMLKRGARA